MSKSSRPRRSFRLEITGLIGLLFLLLLILLSFGVRVIVYRAKLAEIDAMLIALAERVPASLEPWLQRHAYNESGDLQVEHFPVPPGNSIYLWDSGGDVQTVEADTSLAGEISKSVALLSMQPGWKNYLLAAPPGMEEPDPVDRELSHLFAGIREPEGVKLPPAASIGEHLSFTTADMADGPVRIAALSLNGATFALVDDMRYVNEQMAELTHAQLIVLPVALLLVMGGAWIIASRAIRPVKLLAETASRVSTKALDQRLENKHASRELAELIDVFNAMLERLERSFHQASRFSADAAHELRTPLTVLQGQVEQAMHEAPVGSREQRFCSSLLEETQRLRNIVTKLLLLARSDAGRLQLKCDRFDFSALVSSLWEDAEIIGPGLIYAERIERNIQVDGDADLLGQVFSNLLSNAIHHNREDGRVELRLYTEADTIMLYISNTGDGIPPEQAERLFDRFYRVDESRRAGYGTGLGLSLARELARAHNGELQLEKSNPDRITFVLTLPKASG